MEDILLSCRKVSTTFVPHCRPVSGESLHFQRQLSSLNRRITRLEHKVDCADTDTELSLQQLKRRVEKLEKKNKDKNQRTKPKLSTSLKFLLQEVKHWHNIGSLLEISEPTLEQIEERYPGDCQQCVREMIKSWLKQVDPPPSWKDLADAVQVINPCLAKKVLNCETVNTINSDSPMLSVLSYSSFIYLNDFFNSWTSGRLTSLR